jgi:hypothetical protein
MIQKLMDITSSVVSKFIINTNLNTNNVFNVIFNK